MVEKRNLISEFQRGSGDLPHYLFHPRTWAHEGCVIDLGCSPWDWSKCFFGKKRVIGCDPSEKEAPAGAELFRGFVGNYRGSIRYDGGDQNRISSFVGGEMEAEVITIDDLMRRFKVDSISLLKMNIEGMEYDLLIHLQKPVADQMVISFHDYPRSGISNRKATEAVLGYLSEWYDWCRTSKEWSWYVLLRKE